MTQAHVQWQSGNNAPTAAAVAVFAQNTQHTGILFEHSRDGMQVLHLASHRRLSMSPPKEEIGWVKPRVLAQRLEQVAAMCERIRKLHGRNAIPYGFRYQATRFTQGGKLIFGKGTGETGLTCATFVLAVFASVRVPLLKMDEWPARAEDEARFEELLTVFKEGGVAAPALAIMSQQTNAIRYRPLEVAGGSMFKSPASFSDAAPRALELEKEVSTKL